MSEERQKARLSTGQSIFGIVMIPMHIFVIPMLLGLLISAGLSSYGVELNDAYINLACYSISAIIIFAVMYRYLKGSFEDIFDDTRSFSRSILRGFVLYYLGTIIITSLLAIAGIEGVNPNTDAVSAIAIENANVMIVVSVMLGPLVEECMFRAALFGLIARKNRILAYIVSTAAFSIYHLSSILIFEFSWTTLLFALEYIPASIALARTYEKGGSIWASILLHACINAIAMLVTLSM